MDCREFRSRLMDGQSSSASVGAAHRDSCGRCQEFERRWALVRLGVGQPAEHHDGDLAFATRLVARLPKAPEVMGWAALRALPAAVLLALLLAGLGASEVPAPASLLTDDPSSSQLFAWSAQGSVGDAR
jgi:hypothetical protein